MSPEDLINEKQIITQSGHTLVGRPINVHNDELRKLADYVDYRKSGARCGKPLNILEKFAIRVLELHAEDLNEERFWNALHERLSTLDDETIHDERPF